MKKIIVNADDFGINEIVTKEIERMIVLGAISSTSIMANGLCLAEVKRIAVAHPEISFGVHLCLSEFGSVTKSSVLYDAGLIDEHGQFLHKAILGSNKLCDMNVRKAIGEELNAQIDIVSSLGIPISHVDSHHHVHTIFLLREVFSEVLRRRGLFRIRIGEDFRSLRTKRHLWLWNRRVKLNSYYRSSFTTTDAFYSYAEYMKRGTLKKQEEVVELMCHPGHPDNQYCEEMKLVEAKQAFNCNNSELISYNDIY